MKHLVTILLLQAVTLCCLAETREIEHPEYMTLYADGISIERVELSDERTTLHFCATGKEDASVSFLPSTFLMDEQGNRYKAESSQGIELGEWTKLGEGGMLNFSITFAPLPEGTRVFDCIESPGSMRYSRFYGIRAKGQDWNVFGKGTATDNSFPESLFRIDTIHVTGRITDSRYENKGSGSTVHYVNSHSQQRLIRTFRENRGVFDLFEVGEDGTFSFKTLAAKPCLDAINLFGTEIPVLLIPGDHLQIDITHLGEYDQSVAFRSDYGDYSRLLCNTPFMHDEDLDFPTFTDNATLPAQAWQALHEKQDSRLQICSYLSAKHHLTPTELKLMQMAVRSNCALLSISKMDMAVNNKYMKDREVEGWKNIIHYPVAQLGESGIATDFSFLKEFPLDDPCAAALPAYEAVLHNLSGFGNRIRFVRENKKGGEMDEEENLQALTRQLGYGKDIGRAIASEYIATYIDDPVAMYDGVISTGFEKNMLRLKELLEQTRLPHVKSLMEARIQTLSQSQKQR